MTDAGFFRGTSAEQDNRFSDKEKKLLKQMKFADNLTTKIEMNRIKLEVLKPWISKRISELLGMDDDVVVEFVINQLEAEKNPDARKIQINLTGFLNGKNARIFVGELWDMLISAQESAVGIPASMVEAKKEEIRKRNEEQERINETLKRSVGAISRFNERLKQERESSPPSSGRRDQEPSSRDKGRSRSKERDSKSRPSKPDGDDQNSKSRDDTSSQNKQRNYRSRRSSSPSPDSNNKKKSRSRSTSRERRPDRRPLDDIRDRDRERRGGGPDRGRDNRDRPRRSRSPIRAHIRNRSRSPIRIRGGRSRSRSPYNRGGRRSPSPRNIRRRSPPSHRPRRDSSAEPHKRNDERRSKSPLKLLPRLGDGNNAHSNTKRKSLSPSEPSSKNNTSSSSIKKGSGSSSGGSSSSSPERKSSDKGQKSSGSNKRKSSESEESGKSEDEEQSKKKLKKKKKDKKHKSKKHKHNKKSKKSKDKQKSSSDDDDDDESQEDDGVDKNNGILPSERIANTFLKLVEKSDNPSSEELERKLREKALESMKKAAALNR